MSLAENTRAVIGHNSGEVISYAEALPPKALRILNPEHARQIELAGRLLSALFRVARKHIMEKRKGGDEGRAIRRYLIHYARSIGCPVWECAIIFDLNRKQIGQEEAAYIEMLADYSGLDKHADYMTTMLDAGLKVNVPRFLASSIEHINADNEDRREAKKDRQAERAKPKPTTVTPIKPQTEADRILIQANARQRLKWLASQIKICESVVRAGEAKGASKEAQRDAKASAKQMKAYAKEHIKLEAMLTPPTT